MDERAAEGQVMGKLTYRTFAAGQDGEGDEVPALLVLANCKNAYGSWDADSQFMPAGVGMCIGEGCFRTMPKYTR